ncbi:MAG TPA: phosphatase [Janibacter terrae]|nr:phosphatase [Janibacter terrae]
MSTEQSPFVQRRTIIQGAAALAALGPLGALGARTAGAAPMARQPFGPDYGPLRPTKDQTTGLELISLPRGFEYLTFGWTGSMMSDGRPTPAMHDGMAAFRDGDLVRLVRNHENGTGSAYATPAYDALEGAGGTTTLVFDPDAGELVESYASLAGTVRNCAGGPTPWGTWLSCEETTHIAADGTRHGYVFEVPAKGMSDATPIKEMGRFSHEATCVDPSTGIVYLTEDATPSGLYRFVPTTPGRLADGGQLQMLAIGSATYQTYGDGTGVTYSDLSWVTIDQPDPGPGETSTVRQGIAKGGAQFARLEGAWWGNDRAYIVSTSGGPAKQGQVFEYDPKAGTLTVLIASPSAQTLNNPDNICVSPRGGIVLCEDGSGSEYLHGLTATGEIFPFAQNTVVLPSNGLAGSTVRAGSYTGSEWCGSTFEPKNGNWLFANAQSPGITFAITGPWRKGAL